MTVQSIQPRRAPDSLADVLERVLDKGVVIAGDIIVDVLDIELLSIKLRLFVCSAQTAKEMGMDWWTNDPFFSSSARQQVEGGSRRELTDGDGGTSRHDSDSRDDQAAEIESLRRRLRELESRVHERESR